MQRESSNSKTNLINNKPIGLNLKTTFWAEDD